jgi:N-carbamoylputrescine amidase
MGTITVAATQMACDWNQDENVARAVSLTRQAAAQGANVILLQELFETPYFCKDQNPAYFELAHPLYNHPTLCHMSQLAAELGVVLPVSFFERADNGYYNSLVVIDADGAQLGVYRKSHIPDGPGYEEKYYFAAGDTGFKVWQTQFGVLGVGICWDQWFPEAARAMALLGAELLLYPTAIGSEPHDLSVDSRDHWQRVIQGHAAANVMPVVTANRIGTEHGESCSITFYGSSFVAGPTGDIVVQAERDQEAIITARFDLDVIRVNRAEWGVFRDRRPDLYGPLLTHGLHPP